eukprot:CAMPEP_0197026328 /NCGR_PEP_ID=MMETSP1384-20130603/6440_1 /TAXON_ID=29189 /ORGANISM="Ammonia sp." /LENGTH=266 /DNA_ID=CAMNT_0042454971 /DNA_START=19 /DNA_END=815 /DNA_ORIENTATION=+
MTYIVLLLFLSSMICSTINEAKPPSFAEDIIQDSLTMIFWSLAQLFTFGLILSRVHYTLKSSKYQLKEANYIIFTIVVFVCVLMTIVWILRSVLYRYQYLHGDISQHGIHEFSLFFVIFVEIVDLMVAAFFVGLFVKRLKLLVNEQMAAEAKLLQSMRNKMLKYWVLTVCIIIATQLIYFMVSLSFITEYIGDNAANKVLGVMYGILLPLNPSICAICIFLSFDTYHEYYDRGCGCCDDRALRCFTSRSHPKYHLNTGELQQSLLL